MKKQWGMIASLMIILIVVIIAILNMEKVTVSLAVVRFDAPLIVVIICAALLGAIGVALVTTTTIWQQKRQLKQLQRDKNALVQSFDQRLAEEQVRLEKMYEEKKEAVIQAVQPNTSVSDTQVFHIDTHG